MLSIKKHLSKHRFQIRIHYSEKCIEQPTFFLPKNIHFLYKYILYFSILYFYKQCLLLKLSAINVLLYVYFQFWPNHQPSGPYWTMSPEHWAVSAGLVATSALALIANALLLLVFFRRRGLRTVSNRLVFVFSFQDKQKILQNWVKPICNRIHVVLLLLMLAMRFHSSHNNHKIMTFVLHIWQK